MISEAPPTGVFVSASQLLILIEASTELSMPPNGLPISCGRKAAVSFIGLLGGVARDWRSIHTRTTRWSCGSKKMVCPTVKRPHRVIVP